MIQLEYLYAYPYVLVYLQSGHMIQICFAYLCVLKMKVYMEKILLELVLILALKIPQTAIIPMHIMEQEDA